MDSIQSCMLGYQKGRKLMVGISDHQGAWTDGEHWIAFSRKTLSMPMAKKASPSSPSRPHVESIVRMLQLLLHEICHDTDSESTLTHSADFDHEFNERVMGDYRAEDQRYSQGADLAYLVGKACSTVSLWLKRKWQDIEIQEEAQMVPALENETKIQTIPPPIVETVAPVPVTVAPVLVEELVAAKETPTNRMAREVTDPAEIERIWKAYKGNGGKLSFKQIEQDNSFGLKQTNGMTAYRICKRYRKGE